MQNSPAVVYRPLRRLLLLSPLALLGLSGCGGDLSERQQVEMSLTRFADELASAPIDPAALPTRIRAYLTANPDIFGSTVTLLGVDRKATTSPYLYKQGAGYAAMNLVEPGYSIDSQLWLAVPRDTGKAVWTEPYFDDGGGNIWMITLVVPLLDRNGKVYAVVTSDLPVDNPNPTARKA